ncbi:MAG: hypothetical protein FH753_03155 [Firmicutes bacterium]|nr:hypothetical protein [Bacillota bacterium]
MKKKKIIIIDYNDKLTSELLKERLIQIGTNIEVEVIFIINKRNYDDNSLIYMFYNIREKLKVISKSLNNDDITYSIKYVKDKKELDQIYLKKTSNFDLVIK